MSRLRYFPDSRRAFTLVELLVVITIIGILIALLLPAVQAAREAARRTQCTNQIAQIAKACMHHEQIHGWLPTGGWGYFWSGDPDRGFDWHQPGGWLYNILPYNEQQDLHDLGLNNNAAGRAKTATTPLTGYMCPTRARGLTVFPFVHSNYSYNMSPLPTMIARSDYAASLGELLRPSYTINIFPGSLGQGDQWKKDDWYNAGCWAQGTIYTASMCRFADITDGSAYTFLCGEKCIGPDYYSTGQDWGDDQTWDLGTDWDVGRPVSHKASDNLVPFEDPPGVMYPCNFGSAHPVSLNMAMCDGSVHAINYAISNDVFWHLGDRADGYTVDEKDF